MVFNDAIGNYFIGDCIYGNHNLFYPSVNFLQAQSHSGIMSEMASMLGSAGMNYRNLVSQATIDAVSTEIVFGNFAPSTDTIDDRWVWTMEFLYMVHPNFHNTISYGGLNNAADLVLFNDSGHTGTTTYNNANNRFRFCYRDGILTEVNTNVHKSYGFYHPSGVDSLLYTDVYWSCVCDGESLAIFMTQHRLDQDYRVNAFVYMGRLTDVNTTLIPSPNVENTTIFLMAYNFTQTFPEYDTTAYLRGGHYSGSGFGKVILDSGDAIYPITCADAQTPGTQHLSDLVVLEDFGTGTPIRLGTCRNLRYGQGIYTLGQPVTIQGPVFPDAGHNHWLPVANLGTYTIFKRCYSSV